MLIYELLSQEIPFGNIEYLKRYHPVLEGQRPNLHGKATHTPIQLQNIMTACWEQEPENRPTMTQIVDCIKTPEFEQLRAEISVQDMQSISCACVCRMLPENDNIDSVFNSMPLQSLQDNDGIESRDGDGEHTFPYLSLNFEQSVNKSTDKKEQNSNSEVVEDTKSDVQVVDPYTQIWMCGRDKRKGLLEIFTYIDGQSTCYVRKS